METQISFLLGPPRGRPGCFTDEEWGAGLEDLRTQSTSDTGKMAWALPRAGWPLAAEIWIPGSSHVQTPPGAPSPSLSFVSMLGGLREAELLMERTPPVRPRQPRARLHRPMPTTRWRGRPGPEVSASAASTALISLLPSLSLLPANEGQFHIPQGFGALGHPSAGVRPSEQLRKRRWSFRVDRPGTFRARSYQHAGQGRHVGKAGVDGLGFPVGRVEMPSSPSPLVSGRTKAATPGTPGNGVP